MKNNVTQCLIMTHKLIPDSHLAQASNTGRSYNDNDIILKNNLRPFFFLTT